MEITLHSLKNHPEYTKTPSVFCSKFLNYFLIHHTFIIVRKLSDEFLICTLARHLMTQRKYLNYYTTILEIFENRPFQTTSTGIQQPPMSRTHHYLQCNSLQNI